MKKFLIIIYCLSFINGSFLFSKESVYDLILQTLCNNNPSAKINLYSTNIKKENIKIERYKWIPKFGVNANQSFSGLLSRKNELLSASELTVSLMQNLPVGGTLQLFNKQRINFFKATPKEFAYGFTSGARLDFPFVVIVPSLFSELNENDLFSQHNEMEILEIEQQIFEANLVSTTVNTLGNYYLLKKTVEFNKEYEQLLILAEKSDDILWAQGKISTLELSSRSNARTDKQNKMIETKFQFETAKDNLKAMGIYENYTIEDLDTWILSWENFLGDFEITDILIGKLKKLQLHSNWTSQIQNYISAIPKFYVSCDFTPIADQKSYKSFPESVKETFNSKNKVNWNVNLGMNINLDPFANEYSLNKQFKYLKEIQRINEEELNKTLNFQILQVKNTLKMLNEQIKNANNKLTVLKLRNVESDSMYSSGYMSEVEHDLQKLQLKEAELAYKGLRLSKIVYYLRFYTK